MMNGTNDGDDGEDPAGRAADAMADADDATLLDLGLTVLAELKDRDLLRVLLRNRVDAGTLFELEEVRSGPNGLELVAAGFHAETPEPYGGWVREADALHTRLSAPDLSDEEADAILGDASDEALLLELDRAQEEDEEDEDEDDDASASVGPRVAIELLRRGVIEQADET